MIFKYLSPKALNQLGEYDKLMQIFCKPQMHHVLECLEPNNATTELYSSLLECNKDFLVLHVTGPNFKKKYFLQFPKNRTWHVEPMQSTYPMS